MPTKKTARLVIAQKIPSFLGLAHCHSYRCTPPYLLKASTYVWVSNSLTNTCSSPPVQRNRWKKRRSRVTKGLHAVGTVTEPTVTLLFDGIRSMQNIHSRNQGQAVEASAMATRRWRLHAIWWISLGLAFNCFIGITYTSCRATPDWFSYSHYRALLALSHARATAPR